MGLLLVEQTSATSALARRQEQAERDFQELLRRQDKLHCQQTERLAQQLSRANQELLGVVQHQMGVSMGSVTPMPMPDSDARDAFACWPPNSVPGATSRRERCGKCSTCRAPLAAGVRRNWCEVRKQAALEGAKHPVEMTDVSCPRRRGPRRARSRREKSGRAKRRLFLAGSAYH